MWKKVDMENDGEETWGNVQMQEQNQIEWKELYAGAGN